MQQLIRYDAACRAIADCKAIDEVKDWRDKAQALQAYARQAKNRQLEVDAAEIRIRAERRLGGMLAKEGPKPGGDRGNQYTGGILATAEDATTLAAMGISYDLSSRAQQIAGIPEDEFEQTLSEHREEQIAVTGRTMEKLVTKAHVANNSGNNEWYTPQDIVEMARDVLGAIDLDPASSAKANETVQAPFYYTEQDDGLSKEWGGRVWMNPPYAQPLIGQFVAKLLKHYANGDISMACVLVNNATETGWGQALLDNASAVCFPSGRIRFIDQDGKPSGAPLQGQMICYFGKDSKRFRAVFDQLGAVFTA